MAATKQTSNGSNPKSDWNQGYGFQFWRCRHNSYRGDGAFGQYCVMMPDQDAVVAITAGVKDMQAVLNVIWDKLLPAMKSEPLQANSSDSQELSKKLSRLKVRTPQGSMTSPLATKALKFMFPDNDQKIETLSLSSSDSGKTLMLNVQRDGRKFVIPCGYDEWKRSKAPFLVGRLSQLPDQPVAGAFAWPTDDTCVIKLCAYETPHHQTFTLKFDGGQVTLDSEVNVAFGPTKRPQLIGRAE